MLRAMPGFADADVADAEHVTLGPAECRDVNRWWTIARSVTNVAHDLKNALQVITGNVEMLQLRKDFDAATERRLQSIATQAARAVDAIAPLVGYARESPSAQDRVDLHALASVALSFRTVSLGRAGIRLAAIAPAAAPLYVLIDTRAALQLLLNLLLRAEGEVAGRPSASIAVAVQPGHGTVMVVIDGRAAGARPDAAAGSAAFERVTATAIAELKRAYGITLEEHREADHIRFTLSVPVGSVEE
jgi:C4-dicarboxylate-specific signal transduction histidine kinase